MFSLLKVKQEITLVLPKKVPFYDKCNTYFFTLLHLIVRIAKKMWKKCTEIDDFMKYFVTD